MTDWETGLSELVRTRHRALSGYAYLLCSNAREAEDLVQDAYVKVFARRHSPDAGSSEAYVRRAILTIYLDHYRRRRRWFDVKHLVGASDRQESSDVASSDVIDVAIALDALSPRQRACVVLRYFDDLTVPAVAERLGCAEGTVKRHLSDARAVLRDRLGPLGDDGDDASSGSPDLPPAPATAPSFPTPRSTP